MQGGKVVFACVLGAFVGALVGLHFGHLWVSILTGGIVGFLSYEVPVVVTAVPKAWNRATAIYRHPDSPWLLQLLKAWVYGWGVVFNVILVLLAERAMNHTLRLNRFDLLFNGTFLVILSVMYGVGCIPSKGNSGVWKEIHAHIPVLFWLWYVPKWIVLGIIWIAKRTTPAVSVFSRFAVHWLYIIHSELRWLCMVDAVIGATVGYCFHSPIIGAIVGGFSGFLSYEILSIRILKLIPAEQSILARFQ
ncbi:MAG: hypothetical protein ABR884_02730 [Minisyncoccia bacterium]|jgi:uncharacterized membrane protein